MLHLPPDRVGPQRRARTLLAVAVATSSVLAVTGMAAGADDHVPGRVLVKFRGNTPEERMNRLLHEQGSAVESTIPGINVKVLRVGAGRSERLVRQRLAGAREVEFAELDRLCPPATTVVNDPYFSQQWQLPRVAAPSAWDSSTGAGITIAIIDSGVDGAHPDLAPNMVPGWNFFDNNSNTTDVDGHGTAVAGTAAAAGNNAVGVASVAFSARIMPLRVTNTSGCAAFSTMATALVWAADHNARVANLSFAASDSTSVRNAAQYFQNHGGVVCIGAGNSGVVSTAPDNPYALTVSASDSSDAIASWSNTGSNIDLAAPGVNVRTTARSSAYCYSSGTSFSTPMVAGVAALVLSANPALTGAQAQQIIKQSADDLGPSGWDPRFGWGRLNAARAVALATSSPPDGGDPPSQPPPPPPPSGDTTAPSASLENPGDGATVSGNVTVSAQASDNVGVARVDFLMDGRLLGSSTSAPYSVRWNTRQAARGSHTLQAVAYDGAGNMGTSAPISVIK